MRLQATLKLRNAKMIERRLEYGWSQQQTAEMSGTSQSQVSAIELLQFGRLPKHTAQDIIRKIAVALNLSVEEIVPPELAGKTVQTTFVLVREIPAGNLLAYEGLSQLTVRDIQPDVAMIESESRAQLLAAVERLKSPRKRDVLRSRFLVDPPQTLGEVSSRLGISCERVRQVEAKALRDFQHDVELRHAFDR